MICQRIPRFWTVKDVPGGVAQNQGMFGGFTIFALSPVVGGLAHNISRYWRPRTTLLAIKLRSQVSDITQSVCQLLLAFWWHWLKPRFTISNTVTTPFNVICPKKNWLSLGWNDNPQDRFQQLLPRETRLLCILAEVGVSLL